MARISIKKPEMVEFIKILGINPEDSDWAEQVSKKINKEKSTIQGWLTKEIPGWVKEKYSFGLQESKEPIVEDVELIEIHKKIAGLDKVATWYRAKAEAAERAHDALADRVARQLERVEQLSFLVADKQVDNAPRIGGLAEAKRRMEREQEERRIIGIAKEP